MFFVINTNTFCTAQIHTVDTIEVSDKMTTHLVFNQPLNFFDIGNDDYIYADEHNGIPTNILKLKAVIENAETTNMVVREGEKIHAFIVRFASSPTVFLHDLSGTMSKAMVPTDESKGEVDINKAEPGTSQDTFHNENIVEKRATMIYQDFSDKYASFGEQKDQLVFGVTNLAVDEETIYVKMKLYNGGAVDYKLDFVRFAIKTKQKGFGPGGSNSRIIESVFNKKPDVISFGKTGTFVYAIPLYAFDNKSGLLINVFEKEGNRGMKAKIPGKYLAKAYRF